MPAGFAGTCRDSLWLARRRHTATLLDGISLAAHQQKPVANAVMQLAAGYPQRKIARRLWAAYDAMQKGADDLDILYRHNLLTEVDLALLQAAQRNGNLAWAAKELADSNRRRLIYRTNTRCANDFPTNYYRVRGRGCVYRSRLVPTPDSPHSKPVVGKMKRRAFTLIEVFMAIMLLGALTALCLKFFAGVTGQQKEQNAELAATQEAANVMERLAAVAWDDLPKQTGGKFELSPQTRKMLPEPRVDVKVDEATGTPPARRIAVVVCCARCPADRNERRALSPGGTNLKRRDSSSSRQSCSPPRQARRGLRRTQRRGHSLVELVAVITGISVVMGGTVTLLTFVLRMSDDARDRTHTVATIGRLAEQFRRDVHEARGEPLVAADHRSAELKLPGGRTVRWRIDDHDDLVRAEHGGAAADRQNTYSLPQACTVELRIEPEGAARIVRLQIDSPGVGGPSLVIEALAGQDFQSGAEDEK